MAEYHRYKEWKYEVGQRLQTLRHRTNLTQVELAALVEVNRRTVQNWEAGAAYPKEDRLQRLIQVFLNQHVFTSGHEREEAEALWELVSQDAPHSLALFDAAWFDSLRGQELGIRDPAEAATSQPLTSNSPPLMDWGEAIDVPVLYGREVELATLQQWVLDDRCRVIALLGLGGIGKTSLAITLAHQLSPHFDAVLFRSLRNAPLLSSVLNGLIRAVSAQQAIPPDSVPDKIALLVQLFRERRCLLVLDNLEAIIQAGAHTGDYRPGYADYGMLIQWLGETAHRGCLLLTSRERPAELGPLEGRATPVRTLTLTGLDERTCQIILEEKNIAGEMTEYTALARLYGGNPLALKLVSEPIREMFGGSMSAFLATGDAFFNGVGKLLDQQFHRSTPLEQAILYWLAIERELAPLEALGADLTGRVRQREVLQALDSLRRRLLIEQGAGRLAFTLQPVIMEYVTDRLVGKIGDEIIAGQPALLCTHALMQATARDYVRRTQEQLIATPLLELLVAAGEGMDAAERCLLDLLEAWCGQPAATQGYGPGNVVNLLRLLRGHLRGLDLSDLAIRQAYLQEVPAQDASLARAHLSEVVLTETFDYSLGVALSADGAYLAASTQGGEVRLWRVTDRTPIMSVPAHTGGVYGVALAADGRLLASSSIDGTVKVWAAPGGELLATLSGHTGGVYSVALSADQQLIASGGADGTVRLWDTSTALSADVNNDACLAVLHGHTGAIWGVALTEDGRLVASSSADGTIKVWAAGGQLLTTLSGHNGLGWGVALTPDGRLLVSGGADGTVRLWDVNSSTCLAVLPGHTGGVRGVALTADGRRVISSGMDRLIRVWDTSTALSAGAGSGTCLATLSGHNAGVSDLALAANGELLASASFDGTIRLWDVNSGASLVVLQGHSGAVRSVTMATNEGLIASGSFDGMIYLWAKESGACLATLPGHTGLVFGVALSADGRLLASSGHDGIVKLWETSSGRPLTTLAGHTDAVCGLALSTDGRILASGGRDGTVRLWHTESGTCFNILWADRAGIRDVALLADGRIVASGSFDGMIRVWEVDGGGALATFQAHPGLIWRVALRADGQLLASAGEDGTIRIWEVSSGLCRAVLAGHQGAVYGVAITTDGQLLVSSGHDGTIRLWDVASGTCLKVLQRPGGAVWNLALSGDGRLVISGEHDGTIGLWEPDSGDTVRILRPDRPYERLNITGLTGVTAAQKSALLALGAVEQSSQGASANAGFS